MSSEKIKGESVPTQVDTLVLDKQVEGRMLNAPWVHLAVYTKKQLSPLVVVFFAVRHALGNAAARRFKTAVHK